MGRRGPGALPQTEKREQYARLIGQGFSSLEACRIVGINPRTRKRWRHGRTVTARDGRKLHYSPVVTRGKWPGGRSRTGTCPRMSGCGSPTCVRQGPGCGRSRRRQAAARRRSAGNCAVTGIRTAASTAVHRAQAGRAAARQAAGGQDRRRPGGAPVRAGAAGEVVEPAAGQPGAPPRDPRRRGPACRARDDLPGGVPARAGRAVPRPAARALRTAGGGAGRTAVRASGGRTGSSP
jgi:hypothetical protein